MNSSDKKVLVVGGSGVIGKELLKRSKYYSTSRTGGEAYVLDLLLPYEFQYDEWGGGDVVIFLAAISSPDACHKHYDTAYLINVEGTSIFISEMLRRKVKILFFSSDVVYGDTLAEVDEGSLVSPVGEYAEMKLLIERKFSASYLFKACRLSYVLSANDSFINYLKSCLMSGATAEIYHPFFRMVVDVDDVLTVIQRLVEDWDLVESGIINICGAQAVSRKDMAEWFASHCEGTLDFKLIDVDDGFWVSRPKNINVKSKYLNTILGRNPIAIESTIKRILSGDA